MTRVNRNLLITVGILLVLSVLTYRQTVTRTERFQRGQVFLQNLNTDEIAKIHLLQGETEITLQRQGDGFTVVERQGYPVSNESVNRLLRTVVEIGLEREIGSGETLAEELEIEPMTAETTEVSLWDGADKEMVRVRLGKSFDEGPGRYIQRLDGEVSPIYLSSGGVSVSTDVGSYLQKEILNRDQSEVVRLKGADFELEKVDGETTLSLAGEAASVKLKTSQVNRIQGVVSGLKYEEVYLSDDPEVGDLQFEPALRVDLEDGSGYELSYASRDDRGFLRVEGFHSVSQVAISRDESEEQLAEKAEVLTRADEIEAFNKFHGSWTYELGDWIAESLRFRRHDLIDNESS